MSFNGSGTYSLPAGNPVTSNTTISSTVHNNTMSDIASALSGVITKDGQTTITANIPMSSFKLTGLAAGSAAGDSVRYNEFGPLRVGIFPVTDPAYGAVCDGTTDDTAAWVLAVAAAAAAGGGIITAPPGKSSKVTAAITVSNSNVQFYLPNFTFVLSGASDFAALDFEGTGGVATPVLGSNAATYATSISVSTLGGLAAGSWLWMTKNAPNNGGAADTYVFVVKVRSVSGAGPWTITLESPLPIAFNTADAGLALARMSFLENVGVYGKVTFDGSGATGTTVHGVKVVNVVNSTFQGIHGDTLDAGAAIYAYTGHGNTFADNSAEASGNASYNALMYVGQTAASIRGQHVYKSTGFGIGIHSNVYSNGSDWISEGCAAGRGIKVQSTLFSSFSNFSSNWNTGYNGIAIAIGTCNCIFSNLVANGNPTNEGLWLSNQYNCNNQFFGVQACGNSTRDIYIGETDTGNMFFGARTVIAPYIGGSNATTLWFGLNGEFMSGGVSSNAPLLFISNATSGVGATPWIGVASGDLWMNNITGKNITFSINNVACGYVTVNGLQSAAGLRQNDAAALVRSLTALTDGTGAGAGTITNAPSAGNPTKWIPIVDNGTTRWIPTWT